jgi:transposase
LVDVERWAELRREHFVRGVSIKELARRTGLSRNTVRAVLRSSTPPSYRRERSGSKLDPFRGENHRLLKHDPDLPGQRVRELISPLGFCGGKTIVDDYLREVRPFFLMPRTYQRTVYRPGEICQFDLWEPGAEVPVGHGQTREAWVVVACLGYSRAGAGALMFSKQIPELLFGIRRCLWSLGALPETLVWDRQSGLHAGGDRLRSSPASAGSCGSGGTSARSGTRRPRGSSNDCRTSSNGPSSPGACSRTSATTSSSWMPGLTSERTRGCTKPCAPVRSIG